MLVIQTAPAGTETSAAVWLHRQWKRLWLDDQLSGAGSMTSLDGTASEHNNRGAGRATQNQNGAVRGPELVTVLLLHQSLLHCRLGGDGGRGGFCSLAVLAGTGPGRSHSCSCRAEQSRALVVVTDWKRTRNDTKVELQILRSPFSS